MSIAIRANLIERQKAAHILYLLADGCAPEGADLAVRLSMIADLAEEFAEDCRELENAVRVERGE